MADTALKLLPPDGRTKSPVTDRNGNVWCCPECGLSAQTAANSVPLHDPSCVGMPWYRPIEETLAANTTPEDGGSEQ